MSEIEAIKGRRNKLSAKLYPMTYEPDEDGDYIYVYAKRWIGKYWSITVRSNEFAEFILEAPTDIDTLLAEIKKRDAVILELIAAKKVEISALKSNETEVKEDEE